MGVDETVWASVRHAHEETAEPAAQFCRRLGVSTGAYYYRRKREGWPARSKRTPQDGRRSTTDRQRVGSSAPRRTTGPRLVKRLYAAIDQELQQLEAGALDGPVASVADTERRTRTLMNMIRGLEKVLELDADKQKTKRGRGKRGTASGARGQTTAISNEDANRMRQDIAERLERLHAQWADPSGPDGARSKGR